MQVSDYVKSNAKSASIKATVFRADGTVKQDLGVIAYWHQNPLKRWAWAIKNFFKNRSSK